jgi:hypothetical protein
MRVLLDSGGIEGGRVEGGRVAGRRAVPVDPGSAVLFFFSFDFQ